MRSASAPPAPALDATPSTRLIEDLAAYGVPAQEIAQLQAAFEALQDSHRLQQALCSIAQLEQCIHQRTQELHNEMALRQEVQGQLEHQVMHDPLTNLPNRLFLRDQLHRALAGMRRRPERSFALLHLDIDRFKWFNDSLGHQAGDAVLYEFAQRLKESVRPTDVVGRLSGDEFAILLATDTQPHATSQVAQRIQQAMQQPMQIAGRELHVSVSIGIAMGGEEYQTIDEILHDADTALSHAKEAGRQRFVLVNQEPDAAATERLELEQQLRKALARKEFIPFFQPIVELRSGNVVGYEALIRWQHPQRGILPPGGFLAIAEETGLMQPIDWLMYRQACLAARPLLADGSFLSMNVSPRHFQNPHFGSALLQLLADTQLAPQQLHIEVTETTLLSDPTAAIRTLQALQDAGIRTALDDFGTGYSSLGHVHRFPLSMIKIDRSFTNDLDRAAAVRSTAIIQAVLGLGKALALDIVAEGIETDAQRRLLQTMGCRYGQGYYFGRPAPAEHWLPAGLSPG